MDWQLTTDDNGKFQMVIPRRTLSGGNGYMLTASFAGDNYYTSASEQVNFYVDQDTGIYSLNLTGSGIISSGNSDIITATLLKDGSPVNGVVLDYEIKHGATTISTGTTSATDTTGQTTISYTGTGIGDVDIIVSMAGMSLETTYELEDCIFYGNWNAVKSAFSKNTSVSGRTIYYLSTIFNQDVELAWKFKNNIPNSFLIGFADPLSPYTTKLSLYRNTSGQYIFYWSDSSRNNQEYVFNSSQMNPSVDGEFKITAENIHHLSMFYDDVIKGYRDTNTSMPLKIRIDDFANTIDLEYLKIKAL